MRKVLWTPALLGLLIGPAEAQVTLEVRANAVVPTFDIADAAEIGPGFGAGVGYMVGPKVRLMLDGDIGLHGIEGATTGTINTYHVMGKVGYDVFTNDRVSVTLNLGAGIVSFGGDLAETFTYPAINAGGKIAIAVANQVDLLISPQGDIAFSDEAELGTSNSWVWPFGAGLRFRF